MAYTTAQIDAKIAAIELQMDGLNSITDGDQSMSRKSIDEMQRMLNYWKSMRTTVEGSTPVRQIRLYSSKGF